MLMQFALNYSHKAADLLRAGEIKIDLFKCPAWHDLIQTALALHPTYVHFPLVVGSGIGDAIDRETKQRADWNKVESLLKQTDTPLINLHLAPRPQDYPDLPTDTMEPAHVERVAHSIIRDVQSVIARFGVENVIVENDHASGGTILRTAYLPEVVQRVVNETGCGFLFDLSHARLAANDLGMDARAYIAQLPMQRVREMHITGLQRVDERWLSVGRSLGASEETMRPHVGRLMDHLPMTDADWEFLQWALAQIRSGAWSTPWVITCEYGGVSGAWEAITFSDVLKSQVPPMYALIHAGE